MKKKMLRICLLLIGTIVGIIGTGKIIGGKVEQNQKLSDKYLSLFLMMNQWVKIKQEGKNLASYFEQNEYQEIAIYGMSYVGKTLANELVNSMVKIKYGIDQDTNVTDERFDIVSPEAVLKPVDAIVVTPISFFREIEECLCKKMDCPIISLEDILFEV